MRAQGAKVIISATHAEAISLGWLRAISCFGREHLRAQGSQRPQRLGRSDLHAAGSGSFTNGPVLH